MNDKYVVEYSVKQKHFHIDTLETAIKNNQIAVSNKLETDYLIIGVVNTHAEADLFIDIARKMIKK